MKKTTLASLLAGFLLFVLSNGRWTVPVLAWVAPVFLLLAVRRLRPVAVVAVAGAFVAAARLMLHGIIPPELGALGWLLTVYFGIIWFLPYLADRALAARRPARFLFTLVFPCAAVSVEYLNALAFGDWGSVAVTQADNLPAVQTVSVTGLWGLTFLIAWFGPVVLWAKENGFEWARVRKGAAVCAGVLAACLAFGGLRLSLHPPTEKTVRVASLHLPDPEMRSLSRSPVPSLVVSDIGDELPASKADAARTRALPAA